MTFFTTYGLRPGFALLIGAGAISGAVDNASAATTEGLFAARGIGAQTCEAIADPDEDQRDATIASLSVWISGYVSHANRATPDRFDVSPIVDNRVLAAMVTQFCAQNPNELIETVFASVLDMTALGGQSSASELIQLSNGEISTTLRANAMVNVQQALADLDLVSQSDVDGAYGPKTRDALSAFQEQRSLQVTGLPDPVTLLNLFSTPQQ